MGRHVDEATVPCWGAVIVKVEGAIVGGLVTTRLKPVNVQLARDAGAATNVQLRRVRGRLETIRDGEDGGGTAHLQKIAPRVTPVFQRAVRARLCATRRGDVGEDAAGVTRALEGARDGMAIKKASET